VESFNNTTKFSTKNRQTGRYVYTFSSLSDLCSSTSVILRNDQPRSRNNYWAQNTPKIKHAALSSSSTYYPTLLSTCSPTYDTKPGNTKGISRSSSPQPLAILEASLLAPHQMPSSFLSICLSFISSVDLHISLKKTSQKFCQ
jgi:hypothetical protein